MRSTEKLRTQSLDVAFFGDLAASCVASVGHDRIDSLRCPSQICVFLVLILVLVLNLVGNRMSIACVLPPELTIRKADRYRMAIEMADADAVAVVSEPV